MLGDFTTCMVMSGSGAAIGMTAVILVARRRILKVLHWALTVSCVGAAGTMARIIVAPPTVIGSLPRVTATTLASASVAPQDSTNERSTDGIKYAN